MWLQISSSHGAVQEAVVPSVVLLGTTLDMLMGKTQHWDKYVGSGMGLLLDNVNHRGISVCHFLPK